MDLPLIDNFEFSESTEALVNDVKELANRVNEFRPMTTDLVAAVHQKLFAQRVHSSNAIEGNTLTLRETIEVLRTGYVSARRHREGTEAKNLGAAVEMLESRLLREASPHTFEKFLSLHGVLFEGLGPRAGRFRADRRIITGAKHQPPRAELVDNLMQMSLTALQNDDGSRPVRLAAWAHWAIARIHPFEDGNGRMARLWQDLILLRANFAPAIIRLQDRDQNGYYDALALADDGDLNPLTQLIAQRTAATLEQYIAAQQQAVELGDWAERIAGEAASRVEEKRKAEYLRWSRQMESLRNDFQRCAARMTSLGMEVQLKPYPLIDEVAWDNIRSGVGARNTWFFILSLRHNDRRHAYIFFFAKHFWTDADDDDVRKEPRVCLLISEQVGHEQKPVILHEQPDNPILLREVFTVDNDLVAVRLGRSEPDFTVDELAIKARSGRGEGHVYNDRTADGISLAKEFVEHALLRRMS